MRFYLHLALSRVASSKRTQRSATQKIEPTT